MQTVSGGASRDGLRSTSGWARTADGWALNLDGSDAEEKFSLPRLEVRPSPRGWLSLCFLADGTRCEHACGTSDTTSTAKAAAVEQARRLLGPVQAAELAALLEAATE